MLNNKKHCPAIIGIYYFVDGITSPTEIGKILGISTSTVHATLDRKYNVVEKRRTFSDELLDEIEREYIDGASTYTLGDKYGVRHETIGKWMKQRGHVRGKGYTPKERYERNATRRSLLREAKEAEKAEQEKKREAESQLRRALREAKKELRRLDRAAEYAKEKRCASCGAVFHSEYKTKRYCSDTCARREKRHRNVALGKTKLHDYSNHRKRARFYGVAYEHGITLEKLIMRDGNVCQICGEPCDANDLQWGYCGPFYPSIDHIIAMANGGGHTWDNVQLAHCICNSVKNDLLLTEEVIAHAKEQAIAHKCA